MKPSLEKSYLIISDNIINYQGMYIHRLISDRLKRLITAFPVVVVSGARQVGKSTLVQHLFADSAQMVVFDPVLDIENARRDPELFLNNRLPPLVLDEIQYAPELVAAIKRRVDRSRTPGQYILTGTQQWGVLKSLAEVSDWQLFGRFLQLAAALSGQEVNHSQLGRELGLTPQTAGRWLALLIATFQWFEVPAFSGNALKRVSSRPKGYIGDTGLLCSGQAISSPNAIGGHPLWGAIFETAAAAELRKQLSFMSPKPNLYHWRSHSGAEIDFLVELDGKYYPIEVKAKSMPDRRDASSIMAFRKQHPALAIGPGLVVAPTERVMQITEKDYALPWDIR